jgi:signal transduction histidine kinase
MALGNPDPAPTATQTARSRNTNTWLVTGLLITALAAWGALVWAAPLLPDSVSIQLPQVARAISAGLFLTAGVMWHFRWRLTTDRFDAHVAAALILLGAALPVVALVGPLMQRQPELASTVPAGRLSLVLPVLILITTGSRPSRRTVRPMPLAVALLAAWVLAATALADRHVVTTLLPMDVPSVWLIALCAAALCWLVLAVAAWRQGSAGQPTRRLAAIALALMGCCDLCRAHGILDPPATLGFGPGLQLLAAGLVTVAAAAELRKAYRADDSRSAHLVDALIDVQAQLAHVQQLHRERVHDARSAVMAVIGASHLLSQPAERAVPDRGRLHELMAAELSRLQDTLDTDNIEPITTFLLAEALEPVVLAHRLAGGSVDAELGVVEVLARPRATATALANLLDNVRAHAPGARVEITADRRGSSVIVVVDDDGPGISADERDLVLLSGGRGSAAGPGTGLGLHTAAAAMAGQSGTLQLTERPGGGTRAILTLPAAASGASLATVGRHHAEAC